MSEVPPFKYDIETSVGAIATWGCILSPADLDAAQEELATLPPAPIYLIGTRPRIRVDLEASAAKDGLLDLMFESERPSGSPARGGVQVRLDLDDSFELGTTESRTMLHILKEGEVVAGWSAAGYLAKARSLGSPSLGDAEGLDTEFLDLKVVYVGQSTDESGAAGARLLRHETLQKVVSEVQHYTPHLETWLVLLDFGSTANIGLMGAWTGTEGADASSAHFLDAFRAKPTEKQRIALIEAALIRYFDPPYNTRFRETFPKPLHTTYSYVYELDFNIVGVEVHSTSMIGCRLYSDAVAVAPFHLLYFQLQDPDVRRTFFNIAGDADFHHPAIVQRDRSSGDT